MIISILQPAYLPWLGYLERIARSDLCILLDHVEIDRNSKTKFANRNKIRTPDGWSWLTVPIRTKGKSGELALDAIEIEADGRWRAKHLAALRQNYARASCASSYLPFFAESLEREWTQLMPLCEHFLHYLLAAFEIHTPLLRSSELGSRSHKGALILDLVREVGGTRYLSGPFGRDYLDANAFAQAGIGLEFHDFVHPRYTQLYPGFAECMSSVDLLFNHGPRARALLSAAGLGAPRQVA